MAVIQQDRLRKIRASLTWLERVALYRSAVKAISTCSEFIIAASTGLWRTSENMEDRVGLFVLTAVDLSLFLPMSKQVWSWPGERVIAVDGGCNCLSLAMEVGKSSKAAMEIRPSPSRPLPFIAFAYAVKTMATYGCWNDLERFAAIAQHDNTSLSIDNISPPSRLRPTQENS